jgi:Tol biopolymer transport system component/predicted Ser/Thr protein kinase
MRPHVNLAGGTMLGPYEVVSLLGAGGMGEVYRARDTRLDRVVAIKVVRSGFAGGDLRTRFEREARAVSHLSHPHICALYDVGNQDGSEYLVMEYIEGETLADRLRRGPLPLSQVLRYGAQIAEALHHAHRAGITHRDLKPGNVMVTATGAKLLDFGLAKFVEPAHIFSDDSAPETARPLTAEGAIVGTFQYMSPEQLHGTTVDSRSDIFSLGILLYEMTTGQRPFPASSSATLIAAIVSGDPVPLRSLQPTAPPALERIILTALEKNPEERWQTAQDVGRQLRWLAESSSSPSTEATAVPMPVRRRGVPSAALIGIAAIVAALLTYGATRLFSRPATHRASARLQFVPPAGMTPVYSPEAPNFAVSPDGRTLCFVASTGDGRALYLRPLASLAIRKLEGTENAFSPFWSPDGAWIGYSGGGKLWKTPAAGGVPQAICDVSPAGAVASWGGNTILFIDRPGGRTEIYRVPDSGGTAVRVTTVTRAQWRHGWPRVLADGRHFLYLRSTASSLDRQLVLASLDDPHTSVLLRNVSHADLLGEDRLVYVRDGKLLAQHFDAGRAAVTGEPSLIADDVSYFYLSARAQFSAAGGVVVYRTDTSTGRLLLADRTGTTRTIDEGGPYYDVSLSPDGRRAAVTVTARATGLGDIWIYDLAHGVKDRFTTEPGFELHPVWAPDAASIVYSDAPGGALPHLVQRSLASGSPRDILPRGRFQFAGSFTRDGSALYFQSLDDRTKENVLRLDPRTGKTTPVLASGFHELDPQVSPDGAWLAFVSDMAGQLEVYLLNLAHPDAERIRISRNGGENPRWRADGRELFYLAGHSVMSVLPSAAGDWSDVRTTELFRASQDTGAFAVTPDGQSFLLLESTSGPSDALFHVVLGDAISSPDE